MAEDHRKVPLPQSDAQAEVLALIGGRGGMTLAGNKESFAVLYHRGGRWLLKSGDTMTGESSVVEVTPEEAYRAIRSRTRELIEDFGPEGGGVDDADVFAFLVDWPTSI
ncbi:MAG: hypothetical protein F9K19_10585 [Rhizobiaceae bacterium]|nr:MAG: hypothetical protein F9K19_10585 [Rhizobiaceae bacterium]CAG0956483.1 hypothetical protein RHIZO_00472 [Rhizobiaceae bacterium]